MFDPSHSVRLRDEVPDEPLLANLTNITQRQRTALVTLLGRPAIRCVRKRGFWFVPDLGMGWAIRDSTLEVLERDGLVVIGERRAKLTTKGLWYARTAAYREADQRGKSEEGRR